MTDRPRVPWRRWGRTLRAAVLVNWPIKLTALVLSAVLWAAVAAEEPTTQLVPVNVVVRPPPGRALTSPLPQVQALYAGSSRELIKLFSTPPVLQKTIPDTLTGSRYTLELTPGELTRASDIDAVAQDVQPRVITVQLDDVARSTVRVMPRVNIVPDSGYALTAGIAVTPGSVTLRGPENAVREVEAVPTVQLELTGVTGPVRRTVALDTTGLGTARVIPAEVEISADVAPISERVLMGVPILVRSERGQWQADPPAVIVTVRGPSARIVRLTRDSVDVVAVVPPGTEGPARVALEAVPPAGLGVTLTPDSVTVSRRTRD